MKRSTIDLLPTNVRAELEQRLIAQGFSDYRGLSDWLSERGFEISKSAVHRYGKGFKEYVDLVSRVTGQAAAVVNAYGDTDNTMNEALIRLCQGRIFNLMLALEESGKEISPENLNKITRAVADLGRASVQQKKYRTEVQERAESVAADVKQQVQKRGLSSETVAEIERKILGIGA